MSTNPPPSWVPQPMLCGKCGHEWDDWLPSGVSFDVAIAAIKSVRCPKCGTKRGLLMRFKPEPG